MTIEMIEKQHRERVQKTEGAAETSQPERYEWEGRVEEARNRERAITALTLFFAAVIGIPLGVWLAMDDDPDPVDPVADARYEADLAKLAAFQAQQQNLWSSPVSTVTEAGLAVEMAKCREAIKADSKTPYAWIFGDYDGAAALNGLHASELPSVTMTGQVRHEFPNKVLLAEYRCNFRGAGFSDFTRSNEHFMDNYLAE